MIAFVTANIAPLMFAALVVFLLLGYPVAFALGAVALPVVSNVAVWLERAAFRSAVAVQLPAAGSYSSALLRRPPELAEAPPAARPRPSFRRLARSS